MRAIPDARVSVDFGDPPVAAAVWPIDGCLATDLFMDRTVPATAAPVTTPVHAGRFRTPKVGFAYGFGWTWAD